MITLKQFCESKNTKIIDRYQLGKDKEFDIKIKLIKDYYHLFINNKLIDKYTTEKETRKAADYFVRLSRL